MVSDTPKRFSEWLKSNHCGKDNAIHARDMRQWGTRRDIRHMTHELRREGYPICSGNDGYYYAKTVGDIDQTLGFLISIEDDLKKVIKGLQCAKDNEFDA